MARLAAWRLGRHPGDAAYVFASRRQAHDSDDLTAESLLEPHAAFHSARSLDAAHERRRPDVDRRLRFRLARVDPQRLRWRDRANQARAANGCRVPRRGYEGARTPGNRDTGVDPA